MGTHLCFLAYETRSLQNFRTSAYCQTRCSEKCFSLLKHTVFGCFRGTEDHIWWNAFKPQFNSANFLKVTHQMVVLAVVSTCFPFSVCLQQEQRGGRLFPSLCCEAVRLKQTSRVTSASPEEQGAPTCWIRWLFICVSKWKRNIPADWRTNSLFLVYKQ